MASFGDLNRVNTNIQSQDSQLSLNRINKSLSENQMRLSTGLRINRAEDDAAGFSIATKLNSRVAGLEQAMSNVGDAKSVLDIAESSFDQTMDSLIEMKSLATQAANDTLGAEERNFIADKIESLGADINEVANQTVFQDFQLLNGATDASGASTFTDNLSMTFQVGERGADTITTELEAVNVNELFEGSTAAYDAQTADVAGASIGGVAVSAATSSEITSITVLDQDGATAGSVSSLTIDTSVVDATSMQEVADAVNALDIEGFTASVNDTNDGITLSNADTDKQYTATFTGTDLGTAGTTSLEAAEAASATEKSSGQGALELTDFTADQFRSFIGDIDNAISSMSGRVNDIGIAQSSLSVREVTLSQSISANDSAVSRIMDADFAKEQSESVRLQILQQTATSALAQANMGPQSVLGFLG